MLRRGSSAAPSCRLLRFLPQAPSGSSTDGTVVTTPPAPNAAPGAPTAPVLCPDFMPPACAGPAGTLARVNSSPIAVTLHTSRRFCHGPPRRPGQRRAPPPPSGSSLPGPSFPTTHSPHQILTAAVKPASLRRESCSALQAPGPPSSRESTCSGLRPVLRALHRVSAC